MKNLRWIDVLILCLIVSAQLSNVFYSDKLKYEMNERLDKLEAKLDSIQCNKCYTDTIYVDVDDMMQADWQSYTPANKD